MSPRRWLANNAWLNRSLENLLAGWIRFAYRTSTWQRTGFTPMEDALANGEAVIVVLWHQRVMMAPFLFDSALGPICTFTSASRAGRLAGKVVERFGMGTLAMSSHAGHIALTRAVLAKMRGGVSIGMAADGPRGPARVASATALTWARASRKRVFLVSYSARRVMPIRTWDRMWLPCPWTRGAFCCQEWREDIPPSPGEAETERLRQSLQAGLDAVTDASDHATGRLPE